MLSVKESSSVKIKHIPFLGSTHEPPHESQTLKERVIHHSEFPIKFEDYGNTSKYRGHEKYTHPHEEVSPNILPKEWLIEVKRSSEAIQILSPSTTTPCLLRGINIIALHNPTIRTSIMSEFLAKTFWVTCR
jgi:hypothetical protein